MKKIIVFLPLILGTIIGQLINSNISQFKNLPPSSIFPIIWSILYILMGISIYIILKYPNNKKSTLIFIIQLILNLTWPMIFFTFQAFNLAFAWIIVLIILVSIMIFEFYKLNKLASYIQIPYLVWLLIAAYLNYTIIS